MPKAFPRKAASRSGSRAGSKASAASQSASLPDLRAGLCGGGGGGGGSAPGPRRVVRSPPELSMSADHGSPRSPPEKLKVMRKDQIMLPPIASQGSQEALSKRYKALQDFRVRGSVPQLFHQLPASCDESKLKQYLLKCEMRGIRPNPLPFVTGHSFKFAAWDKILCDSDLETATVTLQLMIEGVEEVDLQGNGLLTCKALVPFIRRLFGYPASETLQRFCLNRCMKAGYATMQAVTRLLVAEDGARHLTDIDLGGLSLAPRCQEQLCKAIRDHPSLRSVCLSDVGLGYTSSSKQCVGDLMSSQSILELDIGWNCFDVEVWTHIGERICEGGISSLILSNCSVAHNTNGDVPSLWLIEQLGMDTTLTNLDLSMNRIDFRGALVLEDCLATHRRLSRLNISQNPLGIYGMRSLLRLLTHDQSSLLFFNCEGTFNGSKMDSTAQIFNMTCPGGRYTLDLSRPYHRSLLRMLYKTAERFNISPDNAFFDVVYSLGTYTHGLKDKSGAFVTPNQGKLSLTYSLERAMEAAFSKLDDNEDLQNVLDSYYALTRLRPGYRKIIPLFAEWGTLEGHNLEQQVVLDALSRDFLLTYPQIAQLCTSKESKAIPGGGKERRQLPIVVEIISKLLHCVEGGRASHYLSMLLTSTLPQFIRTYREMSAFLMLNVENPTGHYHLDLGNPGQAAVAERLLLIDRWETGISRRRGYQNVSQRGDRSQLRNELYQERPVVPTYAQCIAEWQMPEYDQLDFDYTSCRRLAPSFPSLDQSTLNRILVAVNQSSCISSAKIQTLRMVSHQIALTAMQLRGILGLFSEDTDRAELLVLFIFRVTDMHNEKVFRVRFADCPDLLDVIRNRLGELTLLPYIQPEQSQFEFEMKFHDERLAASILVYLAIRENGNMRNIRDPSFVRENGTIDPLTLGVPRSWDTFEKCPTSGVFRFNYQCSFEEKQYNLRKQFFQTYGFWKCEVPEDDVMWWAALSDAPDDVLELLEFLVSRYDDIFTPFKIIDGPGGNGSMTLREFEEGFVKKLKCHKFQGPNEKQRIANVFRYLDPGGEGEVSMGEWGVMNNLWKEMRQSVIEFVEFLERSFAGDDDDPDFDFLKEAWAALDEDGSGEIDEQEWIDIVRNSLLYFGPCIVIFRFLDKDDEGTVSEAEFRNLEVFRTKRMQRDSRANSKAPL